MAPYKQPVAEPCGPQSAYHVVRRHPMFHGGGAEPAFCSRCGKVRTGRHVDTIYKNNGVQKKMIVTDKFSCGTTVTITGTSKGKLDSEVSIGLECAH